MVVADQTAVDDEGGTGAVGAVVGGEEEGKTGDLIRRSHATERDVSKQSVELRLVGHEVGVDGGGDGAGSDVVDGDVVGTQFDRKIAHEHANGSLRGAVGGEVGEDHVLMDGTDVDDATGEFGGDQALDEGLSEKECALEIDVKDGVVVFFGDFPEGGFDLDAGVVDENVGSAELGVALVDEPLGVGEDGDVSLDGDGLAA